VAKGEYEGAMPVKKKKSKAVSGAHKIVHCGGLVTSNEGSEANLLGTKKNEPLTQVV